MNGKKNYSFLIGEIIESEKGILHGRINGQKVFLKQIQDKDGRPKWLVNQMIEGFLSDPKPRPGNANGSDDPYFQG